MATPASTKEILQANGARAPETRRVRARLRLDFSRDTGSGQTLLANSYQEPPLRVVRAFSLPDGSALAHLHNVSGGLLGGDHLTQQITVATGAKTQLTTTGATRIYRHRSDFSSTTQLNEITVGEGALLEYLPDATIPFAGARYRQHTSIQLAAGAGLFWWEILAPGREAGGEIFEYDELEVKTRITAPDRILAAENFSLVPGSLEISSLARLAPYRYMATFYVCCVGRDGGTWRAAEERLRELSRSLTRAGEILWGVSTLVAHGLIIRCLALNGREILPGLQVLWQGAKRHLYDQDAIPPRKVN
jgi:urease accessory protein